jgi:hypothetical protein
MRHFHAWKIGPESSNQIAQLFRQMTWEGYNVVVSHPKKTRYVAEAKNKSEAKAEQVRLNALPLAYFPI